MRIRLARRRLTSHLGCALFNTSIKVEVTHVPYRSTAQRCRSAAGAARLSVRSHCGRVPQIEGKLIKALAIMSRQRSRSCRCSPPPHEQGLADFEVETWYALFLPKGTPPRSSASSTMPPTRP